MQIQGRQTHFLIYSAAKLVDGLNDSHLALMPAPGLKTAGWLVGHLAVTGDFGRRLCGRQPICPKEWRPVFSPETTPSQNAGDYPAMTLLTSKMLDVYRDLADAAKAAPDDLMSKPNPYLPAAEAMPAARDFVGYLMTGHFAYHMGQLFAWRAAAGLK